MTALILYCALSATDYDVCRAKDYGSWDQSQGTAQSQCERILGPEAHGFLMNKGEYEEAVSSDPLCDPDKALEFLR